MSIVTQEFSGRFAFSGNATALVKQNTHSEQNAPHYRVNRPASCVTAVADNEERFVMSGLVINGKYIEFDCDQCGRFVRDYASNRRRGVSANYFCSRTCKGLFKRTHETKSEKDAAHYIKNVHKIRKQAVSYYQRNKERILAQKKRADRELKQEIIDAYGGECECCGESIFEFLTIDHTNGDGAEHRRQLGGKGRRLYAAIKAEGFPKGRYRLLCFNCNITLGFYGYCPHHPERKSSVSHVPFNPGRKRTVQP
jgi:hypothetical protein